MNRLNQEGIHSMIPYEVMTPEVRRFRDTYARKPDTPFYRREMYFFGLDRWRKEGLPDLQADDQTLSKFSWNADVGLCEFLSYDPPAMIHLNQLGGGEPALVPAFEIRVLEDRGDHELVQDATGRHVLYFKGRRSGYMPEYVDHPVKDQQTWEENVRWRMDPNTPARYVDLEKRMAEAKVAAGKGWIVSQNLVGGYMYLRSLMGPVNLLYLVYDQPDLIHECMKAWFELADGVIARHQQYVTIDQILLSEDITYNHGSLISPEMIREFLFPYYQQLISNLRSRQQDKGRHLFIHLDTDGLAPSVIPLYREGIGVDVVSPFEVASGCDVVEIGRRFPEVVIMGGIDKRILAKDKPAIDRHLEYILPAMRERGGYCPTCDHGVPEEVSLENYLHYRKRCMELGG